MKKAITHLLTVLAFVALSVNFASAVTWKLSHALDKNHPVHKTIEYFAKKTKEYTNGNVIIRIYPNAILGTERESLELMNTGALQIAKVSAAPMEAFDPTFAIFSLPYIFNNRDAYYKTLLGDIGKRILASPSDKGYVGLAFFDAGARSFYTHKKIETPDDLKGLKIRTMNGSTAIKSVNILGGVATPMPQGDVYTALQSKVIDGAENNPPTYSTLRHFEVAPILSLDEHSRIPDLLIVSKSAFEKLSKEHQEAVRKAALEATIYMRDKLWPEAEAEAFKILEANKVQIVKVNKAAFRKKAAPMYEEFKKKNPNLAKDLDTILGY